MRFIAIKGDIDSIDLSASTLSKELIAQIRGEFEYYYPMDLSANNVEMNRRNGSKYNLFVGILPFVYSTYTFVRVSYVQIFGSILALRSFIPPALSH